MSLPNAVPTDSRVSRYERVIYTFLVLTTIFFALRVWVRLRIQHSFNVNDWLALATLLFFYALLAVEIVGLSKGGGKHIWEISIPNLVFCVKLYYVQLFLYLGATTSLRLSIGMLLIRVIPGHSVSYARATKIALYAAMTAAILIGLGFGVLTLLTCHPISNFWTRFQGIEGTCIDTRPVYKSTLLALSVLSGLEDLSVALIPGVIVWQMNIRKRSKVLVHCLMAMGCVASVGNWVRIRYFKSSVKGLDFLYDDISLATWSNVEIGLGLFASCAATLRPMLGKLKFPTCLKPASMRQPTAPPTIGAKAQKRNPMELKSITILDENIDV